MGRVLCSAKHSMKFLNVWIMVGNCCQDTCIAKTGTGSGVHGRMMLAAQLGAGLAQHVDAIARLQRRLEHFQLRKILPSCLHSHAPH